jgi:hypothetical protein
LSALAYPGRYTLYPTSKTSNAIIRLFGQNHKNLSQNLSKNLSKKVNEDFRRKIPAENQMARFI